MYAFMVKEMVDPKDSAGASEEESEERSEGKQEQVSEDLVNRLSDLEKQLDYLLEAEMGRILNKKILRDSGVDPIHLVNQLSSLCLDKKMLSLEKMEKAMALSGVADEFKRAIAELQKQYSPLIIEKFRRDLHRDFKKVVASVSELCDPERLGQSLNFLIETGIKSIAVQTENPALVHKLEEEIQDKKNTFAEFLQKIFLAVVERVSQDKTIVRNPQEEKTDAKPSIEEKTINHPQQKEPTEHPKEHSPEDIILEKYPVRAVKIKKKVQSILAERKSRGTRSTILAVLEEFLPDEPDSPFDQAIKRRNVYSGNTGVVSKTWYVGLRKMFGNDDFLDKERMPQSCQIPQNKKEKLK